MKSMFEEMGGTYIQVGDYLFPNLCIKSAEQRPIGKYGRMRKSYLKEQRPVLFSALLLTGKLYQHLADIDQACEEHMERITRQMAEKEAVSEALKAANQMEWVARMNSIQNHAEEFVLNELVYD